MFRWMTAEEPHGLTPVAMVERVPAGLELQTSDFKRVLWRRRLEHGRGTRQEFGRDRVKILNGVRHGLTFGAPTAIEITNSEWPKWETVMLADPADPQALLIDAGSEDEHEIARNKPLIRSRPGHADLAGVLSCELEDARPVLERASTRETVTCVILGAVTEVILSQVGGVQLLSHVAQVGNPHAEEPIQLMPGGEEAFSASAMRTLNADLDQRFHEFVGHTKINSDTIGRAVEVIVWGVPISLGSHASTRARLDAEIARAFVSVQSVKGVEIGDSFTQATMLGSEAHDEILKGPDGHLLRASNYVGGVEGSTLNGQPIVVRATFKTISTVPYALRSVDPTSGEEAPGLHQRSDTCQLVPGALVAQAELALVLADALFEHAGGKSVAEARCNSEAYRRRMGERT